MILPNEKKESQFIEERVDKFLDMLVARMVARNIQKGLPAKKCLEARKSLALIYEEELDFLIQSLELQRERIIEDFSKLESFKAEDKFGNSVEIIRKDQAIEIIKKL